MKIILSFDLDFTLIDNREGIINSFNYATEKYGVPNLTIKEIENMGISGIIIGKALYDEEEKIDLKRAIEIGSK